MKKLIVVLVVLIFQFSNAAWLTSFEEAQKLALATNKLILVDFYTPNSNSCGNNYWRKSTCNPLLNREKKAIFKQKVIDFSFWNDMEIQPFLVSYVFLKRDEINKFEIKKKLNLDDKPTLVIIDGNGKKIFSIKDYISKSNLVQVLKNYALSTEFLYNEELNYFENPSYFNSLRLAQKCYDYSMYLDNEIKNSFWNLADLYLLEAKTKVIISNPENLDAILQRIELMKCNHYLFDKNFEKLEILLKQKFKVQEVFNDNLDVFYLLSYCSAKGLNSKAVVDWEERINLLENGNLIINKSKIILGQN